MRRGRRRKLVKPPTKEEVKEAMDKFLSNGGKINRIERMPDFNEVFNQSIVDNGSVDNFLMGN